jgi:hypothetical protein
VSGVEKAQFTFELPPSTEKERFTPGKPRASVAAGSKNGSIFGDRVYGVKHEGQSRNKSDGKQFPFSLPKKADRSVQSSPVTQPQQLPKPQQPTRREENQHVEKDLKDNKNSFTILTNQDPKEKQFIRKTLPKSQTFTYRIDTHATKESPPEEPQVSQSFPPSHAPAVIDNALRTPSTTPGGHRRTKSVITPTRSSRRARFTNTYAEDSHREFIRDLREMLGQKKAKRDQEEKAIEEQIKKLREEGQAAEKSLAAEIPRLPELLARKV